MRELLKTLLRLPAFANAGKLNETSPTSIPYFGHFSAAGEVLTPCNFRVESAELKDHLSHNLQENGFSLCQDLGNMT